MSIASPTTVDDCKKVDLPRHYDRRGSLTPICGGQHVPFDIARTYFLYDVPGGETRGGHAHRDLQQLVVAVMGAFDLVLDDGTRRKTIRLDRAYVGVYIPRMIWRELENFSSGGICLCLASTAYDEADYIRDYSEFLYLKGLATSERSTP